MIIYYSDINIRKISSHTATTEQSSIDNMNNYCILVHAELPVLAVCLPSFYKI